MKIVEFVFETGGYAPPEKPLDYSDKQEFWDTLKSSSTEITAVLELREYIINISNNYLIPPKQAFTKDGKNELMDNVVILKNQFKNVNVAILEVLQEIENYLHSMD